MKKNKVTLPVITFTLSIAAAFASDLFLVLAKDRKVSDNACVTGTLVESPTGTCSTINNPGRCSVVIEDQGDLITGPALTAAGTCEPSQALFYAFVP